MKLLFDFFPIVVFFLLYKLAGIYVATAAFIVAASIQMGYYWLRHHRIEKLPLITFILGLVMGGATLLFHNELFIKWKPTAIYWVLALFFGGSQWFAKKTLLQSMIGNKIDLPRMIWLRLNMSWAVFFTLMGIVNLYVAYHYDTNTWVDFKLFGMLGLTLVFVIIQGFCLNRHMRPPNQIMK
jgi:intracellular septation protein